MWVVYFFSSTRSDGMFAQITVGRLEGEGGGVGVEERRHRESHTGLELPRPTDDANLA